ncbi:MAG: hypothetical protein JJU15_06115 [Pararhodobacter sp.]|nr:hypothetical protein [Pararhodobacter sp.]
MALKPRLELRQTQSLALSPQMRVALSVLRMSPLELTEELAREAARNPFLVHVPPPSTPTGTAPDDLAAQESSLAVSLSRQLAMMGLPVPVRAAAQLLVGELREDGMLDTGLDVLSEELSVDGDVLAAALDAIQRCEPAGVGARTLTESLCLQLTDRGLSPAEAAQTIAHLSLFVARDWVAIARVLGLSPAQAERRADLARGLTTRPVTLPPMAPETLSRADLRLESSANGTLSVGLAQERPAARLDESLARRAEADGFAPELLARARALLAALDQRGQTLLRIGAWLLENQSGFFHDGPAAITPLTRVRLAEALKLHPSTIGRAIAGKTIEINGRLWPLSVFFSATIPSDTGEVSARQVQARISAMIAAEPRGQPLSDQELVRQLHAEGVDIARRTVAKYRQDLRIPATAARRRSTRPRRQS